MKNSTVFNIMKLIFFSKFSITYAENVVTDNGLQGQYKAFWTDIINRHNYIINKIKASVPADTAEKLRLDMEHIDIESLDSIINMLLTFTPEARGEVETYLNDLAIKFLKENKEKQQLQAL